MSEEVLSTSACETAPANQLRRGKEHQSGARTWRMSEEVLSTLTATGCTLCRSALNTCATPLSRAGEGW